MFSLAMKEALTRTNFCFRAYVKLTSCSGEVIYIRSHIDVLTPEAQTSEAEISFVGGRSQSVDSQSSSTTIGNTQFTIQDFDQSFTRWAASLRGCTLAGTTFQYFVGDQSVSIEEYYCVSTTILTGIDTKFKRYTFNTDDTTRLSKNVENIFEEDCAPHFGTLFDFNTVEDRIPVDTTGSRGDENPRSIFQTSVTPQSDGIDDPDELALIGEGNYFGTLTTLQQRTPWEPRVVEYGQPPAIFIKTDNCEIMQIGEAYGGVVAREIFEERDEDPASNTFGRVTQEAGAPSTGFRYPIIDRELLGTRQGQVENRGDVIKDGETICRAFQLKGPAPWLLYAFMTGRDIETGEVILDDGNHAGIDPKWINIECMSRALVPEMWTQTLDFRCPEPVDPKAFWEEQILSYIDAYMRVDCDGRWCLTPLPRLAETDQDARILDHDQIIRIEPLVEDYDFPTAYFIAFDKDACSDSFNNGTSAVLSDDSTECIEYNPIIRRLEGIRSSFDSLQKVFSKACRLLTQYGQSRWRTSITLCIANADIQPGDSVRARTPLVFDYHGDDLTLDRTFSVTRVSTDWRLGSVTIVVEAPTKEPSRERRQRCDTIGNPCGKNYCEGREVLQVENNTIPAGQTLQLPAGNYCHIGNLRIDGTIKQTTKGTINIAVAGVITGTGLIDTRGAGLAGGAASPIANTPDNTVMAGFGLSRSQGGVFIICDDEDIENVSTQTQLPNAQQELIDRFDDINSPIRDIPDPVVPTFGIGDNQPRNCRCDATLGGFCDGRVFGDFTAVNPTDLLDLQLWGNGGCGGGGVSILSEGNVRNFNVGGSGGTGGGGLVVVAFGFNTSEGLQINTNGLDAQAGTRVTFFEGTTNEITAVGGGGAGGAPGRVLLAIDGAGTNTLPAREEFIRQSRGLSPATRSDPVRRICSGRLGSDNGNLESQSAYRPITLDCTS